MALAANSPFTRGRDSGLASARTPVFQAFPRTGIPREMASYAEYVESIDVLMRCGAIPEPTFIWWDVRLQPKLGTLEVRVMDAQTRIRDTAALAALVQCLVRCEALGELAEPELSHAPEVLDENRFLAARDGIEAQLLDPHRDRCVPASGRLATLVDACWPHARALGCERELALLAHLAGDPGAAAPARDRLRAVGFARPAPHAAGGVLAAAAVGDGRRRLTGSYRRRVLRASPRSAGRPASAAPPRALRAAARSAALPRALRAAARSAAPPLCRPPRSPRCRALLPAVTATRPWRRCQMRLACSAWPCSGWAHLHIAGPGLVVLHR